MGYSDLTAVHAALRNIKVESIHETMPGSLMSDSDGIDYSALSLRSALWGEVTEYKVAPHPLNHNGQTQGVLVGGNLTLIESINGTRLDFDLSKPFMLIDPRICHDFLPLTKDMFKFPLFIMQAVVETIYPLFILLILVVFL